MDFMIPIRRSAGIVCAPLVTQYNAGDTSGTKPVKTIVTTRPPTNATRRGFVRTPPDHADAPCGPSTHRRDWKDALNRFPRANPCESRRRVQKQAITSLDGSITVLLTAEAGH